MRQATMSNFDPHTTIFRDGIKMKYAYEGQKSRSKKFMAKKIGQI